MKLMIISLTMAVASAVGADLDIGDGTFETLKEGTVSSIAELNGIDGSTFGTWRFFGPTDSHGLSELNAAIVPRKSADGVCMRLHVAADAATWSYGIDSYNSRFDVDENAAYELLFDAALVGGEGTKNLGVLIPQYDASGNFIDQKVFFFSVSDGDMKAFQEYWKPFPGATKAYIIITPLLNGVGSTTIDIDNIQMKLVD